MSDEHDQGGQNHPEDRGDITLDAALVLGSGLSALGDDLEDKVAIPFSELKGFPGGGVSGHGRDLLIGTMGGKRIAVLTGREHYYEHGNAAAMRPALETIAELGAKTLLLTNSAGSLDRANATGRPDDDRRSHQLCRHEPADRGTNRQAFRQHDQRLRPRPPRQIARDREPPRHFVEGGRLSLVLWSLIRDGGRNPDGHPLGADAVGMSTAPEVILARMLGLKVWACSSITNMGAGLSDEQISHEHTKIMAVQGAEKLRKLIPALVEAI